MRHLNIQNKRISLQFEIFDEFDAPDSFNKITKKF